jgi:A/G-specific adenine glycosylase
VAERTVADDLVPDAADVAATWAVAVMELGALVCTARAPRCADCPLASTCEWRRAGWPEPDGPPRRGQRYAGTDRQVRGLLLAVLRGTTLPVPAEDLASVWDDAVQRDRAMAGLIEDGLVEPLAGDRFRLPAARSEHD